jgi:membrane-associated phospholipid phosphatase
MRGLSQRLHAARIWLANLEANSPFISRLAEHFSGRREADPIVVRSSLLIWGVGGAMAIFVLIWAQFSDFHVDRPKMIGLVALSGAVAIGSLWVRRHLALQLQPMLVEAYAQVSSISCIAVLVSYEIGSLHVPYRDALLAQIDHALGLDWVAMTLLVARHEWLQALLRFAYQSFIWQPVVVIGLLALSGAHRRLQVFMLAWAVALAIALGGLALAPARTAWIHFGAHTSLPDLGVEVGSAQATTLEALRAGGLRNLLNDPLEGIVAFPSFHTVGALLYAWALWEYAWLRWSAVGLNGLMILATPVIGAHYFIDTIAGACVAPAALKVARWMTGAANINYALSLNRPVIRNVANRNLAPHLWPRKHDPSVSGTRPVSQE